MPFSKLYLCGVLLKEQPDAADYLADLPLVRALSAGGLDFRASVTFIVGENGSGKSTLLEALAVAWGFNPEGGSRNFNFATRSSHSRLGEYLRLIRGHQSPQDGFFLRAESFYNTATAIENYGQDLLVSSYGGRSLHELSHGESFLSLVNERFWGHGLYLLDEPEAALSPSRQLALLCSLHELVQQESQFIIATHSPLLMAFPGAEILLLDEDGIRRVDYRQTEHYQLTRRFLQDPEAMLRQLWDD